MTEMVPDLFLAPRMPYDEFHAGPNLSGPKYLGDQISWRPKKSGTQMRSEAFQL